MELITTRLSDLRVDAPGAILRGLAPDGGLFLPDEIPAFSPAEIRYSPRVYLGNGVKCAPMTPPSRGRRTIPPCT